MKVPVYITRRRLLAAGLGVAFASSTGSAATVQVVRGSRSSSSEPDAPQREGSVRIVRPGQQADGANAGSLEGLLSDHSTRRVLLEHAHTGERLNLAYWRDGAFAQDAQPVIRWFLRDWREAKPSPLSIALLDAFWAIQTQLTEHGDPPALRVLSAYRTKRTNDALARSGIQGVALDSFHLRGMAADIHCPARSRNDLESACLDVATGGVGLYRRAGFVHIDTGPSRRWAG